MSLFPIISCLFFLINLSLSANYLNLENLDDLEKKCEEEKWNVNLLNEEALKPLKHFYSAFHSFLQTLMSDEMKYVNEKIPLKIDLKKEVYEYNNVEEFKENGNRFYGKVLFAIQWINKAIDFLSRKEQLKEYYDRDLKYLSFIEYYLEKTKLRFENHWESIFDQIGKIENESSILFSLSEQFENKDYIESMKKASKTTDDLINNRNYYLVSGFISSEKLDFLNGLDNDFELEELSRFYELDNINNQFYKKVLKKKSLTGSHTEFGSFLYFRIFLAELKYMKKDFPFKVALKNIDFQTIPNDIENEFKIHANIVYNKILFAIQWNNNRIDCLSKNEKLKDFYRQDLVYLSMIKHNLNRSRELFIKHLEKLFSKIEAYKSNEDEKKRIIFLREIDKEIKNDGFEMFLVRAYDTVKYMENGESKLSNTEWIRDIEPNLEKSLDSFVENNHDFIRDFNNRKTLEKYYKELLVFLQKTREIMDGMKDNIPFDIKGSKLVMNQKDQTFNRIANECYQRLLYANRWVQDRNTQLSYYNREDRREVSSKYRYDTSYLDQIGRDAYNTATHLHGYIVKIYDNIAAYKNIEGKYFESKNREKIIDLLGKISRERYFIGKTNHVIGQVTELIKKVSEGKETFEDDTENEKYKDNVSEEINAPTGYSILAGFV